MQNWQISNQSWTAPVSLSPSVLQRRALSRQICSWAKREWWKKYYLGVYTKKRKFPFPCVRVFMFVELLLVFANPHTFCLSTYFPELSSAPPSSGLKVFLCFQDHHFFPLLKKTHSSNLGQCISIYVPCINIIRIPWEMSWTHCIFINSDSLSQNKD